jgi:uncharacterized membrane protein YdjX (TVP38/TMEM64 family)
MAKEKTREMIGIAGVVLLFILSSWLVQTHLEAIARAIGDDARGMAIYILASIATIVLAPVASIPLIPIAAGLWGGFITGLLSIFSWTIGAMIAFGIARTAGIRFVRKMVSLERIDRIEKRIPEKGLFWTIVFLRVVVPVDILSYALGLFSRVRAGLYFWATLIGITPFAFVLAYAGKIPFSWQIIGLTAFMAVGLLVMGIRLLVRRFR